MRYYYLLACALLVCNPELVSAQSSMSKDSRISLIPSSELNASSAVSGLYSNAAQLQLHTAIIDRKRSAWPTKGMIIGGIIGAATGLLASQFHEYGTETACSFWCYSKRVGGGAAVGAILGGIIHKAIVKEDSMHVERRTQR